MRIFASFTSPTPVAGTGYAAVEEAAYTPVDSSTGVVYVSVLAPLDFLPLDGGEEEEEISPPFKEMLILALLNISLNVSYASF